RSSRPRPSAGSTERRWRSCTPPTGAWSSSAGRRLRPSTATGTNEDLAMVNALREVLAYPFMVNAFRAGAIVAVVASAMGWFMVLRRETFAGHTLSVVGFPGAAGAVLFGWPAAFGYFGFFIGAALVLGAASRSPP